jgi:hypothetical protein
MTYPAPFVNGGQRTNTNQKSKAKRTILTRRPESVQADGGERKCGRLICARRGHFAAVRAAAKPRHCGSATAHIYSNDNRPVFVPEHLFYSVLFRRHGLRFFVTDFCHRLFPET